MVICKEKKAYYAKMRRRTLKGKISLTYDGMLHRVKRVENYKGLSITTRKEFTNWSLKNKQLREYMVIWAKNNYDQKTTPSIDRINPRKGYTLDNIRWIPKSENTRRACRKNRLLSSTKLSWDEINDIRSNKNNLSDKKLAEIYKCSRQHINAVRNFKTRKTKDYGWK